jgi:hypothetical protein
MRATWSTSTAIIVGLGVAVLLSASPQPAVAGPVCNELDLRSPCIRSNDIRPNIALGGSTGNARLRLRNEDGANGLDLQASTGNVTNLFSIEENESNGLVKAWARINLYGTIGACWRCNTDPNQTRRTATGVYRIDFTPLATNIRGRPLSATVTDAAVQAVIRAENDPFDLSAIEVTMTAPANDAPVDRSFVVIIY